MRVSLVIPLFCLLFILPACLTVETVVTRIVFDESKGLYRINIIYDNISSAENLEKDVQADLEYLINQAEDESYLLERTEQGFYIKNRRLYIQNNKIMAEEVMITRSLSSLDNEFNLTRDSTYWIMALEEKDNDFDVIESNGETVNLNGKSYIRWPYDTDEIFWKSRIRQLPDYFDRNRSRMVGKLKAYLDKVKDKEQN